ncbi:Type 1 glutamine amidotransferase-like domain-containing protein [Candidatus Saccharibacteria bacterium]|nr:Type 1 glutamine amidotransferase-like domain-containing protein [Candidatus Saccharibacteria bacterium]
MTTYILAGGATMNSNDFGRKLSRVISDLVAKPRILNCFFMRPEEEWENFFTAWTGFYEKYLPQAEIEIAQYEGFLDQIKNSDVLYLHGGSTRLLLEKLKRYENLPNAWRGKIIVANSAGANSLAQHFLHRDGQIGEGLGVLPFNIVVHYGSDDEAERRVQPDVNGLMQKHPEIPTLLLREAEFTIFQEAK